MKYVLHTSNGEHELDAETILANDVTLPGESHCYNNRLWVIGHEYGAICAIWGTCEQDVLDEMIDKDLGDCFLCEEHESEHGNEVNEDGSMGNPTCECAYLGNASEACNLDYAWMCEVKWDVARDYKILFKLAEARGAAVDNLGEI